MLFNLPPRYGGWKAKSLIHVVVHFQHILWFYVPMDDPAGAQIDECLSYLLRQFACLGHGKRASPQPLVEAALGQFHHQI